MLQPKGKTHNYYSAERTQFQRTRFTPINEGIPQLSTENLLSVVGCG